MDKASIRHRHTKVKINNFKDYKINGKPSTRPFWFKMPNDFLMMPEFSLLTHGEIVLFIYIISLCSKTQNEQVILVEQHMCSFLNISWNEHLNMLKNLNDLGMIKYTRPELSSEIPPRKKERVERVEKSRKEKKENSSIFDFEDLYFGYPRKQGKKRGIESLKKKIKTESDYENFKKAVRNYADQIRRDKTEIKYIKLFSSFVNCWEDYVEPEKGYSKTYADSPEVIAKDKARLEQESKPNFDEMMKGLESELRNLGIEG